MNFKDPERYDLPTSKVVLFLKYAGEIFSFFFFSHQIKFSPKKKKHKKFPHFHFPRENKREYYKNMVENRKIFSLLDKRAFVSENFAKNSRGMLRKKKKKKKSFSPETFHSIDAHLFTAQFYEEIHSCICILVL